MKSILAMAGILAASITAASATPLIDTTVGVMNTNGHTILDATGSISNATFATNVASAFTNNTGGVWDFNSAAFGALGDAGIANGDTITLSYGTSATNSLVMTLGSTDRINQSNNGTGELTSAGLGMGLGGDSATRTFTLSTPLQSIGIFLGNRNDNARSSVLTVTFLDNTTASTSGALAGPNTTPQSNYFEGLSATGTNYIKSFSIAQNAFVRYDDLGFVVVPEPNELALVAVGMVGTAIFVRRRRMMA